MESTGVLWRPVYNVLEDDQRSLLLVNPRHLKTVPGRTTEAYDRGVRPRRTTEAYDRGVRPRRTTDVKESEWLADLLRHGLLTASFIRARPIRVLRDLTRYRKCLVQQRAQKICVRRRSACAEDLRAQKICRLQKVLETANLKLSAVVSDITGASGRRM